MQSTTVSHLISNSKTFFGLEGLVALYVYGSLISGKLREESDIDIAILPCYKTTDDERIELISKVEGCVSSILKDTGVQREVSVLDLRGKYVSLLLQYKVITEGIILYENSKEERFEFENAVKGEYFDFVPFIESLRKRSHGDIFQKV
ncbi:MAG: nucleotidyltransferase domain-containing protein [Nitrospirae bacterium]|nr:nucleotidyltransferase domain-containing protein [Nitrospirota bacterium]